ncbi:hypothetical protein V4R08_16360 (plasmid) [Nitrobacter sp. NHB1]
MAGKGGVVWRDEAGASVKTLDCEPRASIWRRIAAAMIGLLPIESQL